MSAERLLIVNADDFGLTAGVNRAVRAAHEHGVLSSTSVLAAAAHALEAEAVSRDCPELDFGVHVNLTLGAPAAAPSLIPSLVTGDGMLAAEDELLSRLLRGRVRAEDVYREVGAQIDRVRAAGVEPTHWDAHRAVAFWPGLCAPAARAARDSGLRRVRTPRIRVVDPGRRVRLARWRWRLRHPHRRALTEANRHAARLLLRRHFAMPGWRLSPNLVDAERLDYARRWAVAGQAIPPGVSEMVCHPAELDDELRRLTPGLVADRATDLAVLCSPEFADGLRRRGVRIIGFRHLAPR